MSSKKPYILVAEDEEINQMIFCDQLEKDYEINVVSNGKECLASIKDRMPDLLLLDINMPVMSGFDVLLELHDGQDYKNLPIIFVTATAVKEIIDLPKDLSASAFLTKPYKKEELLSIIKDFI